MVGGKSQKAKTGLEKQPEFERLRTEKAWEEKARQVELKAFYNTPTGRAKLAFDSGDNTFQIALPLSATNAMQANLVDSATQPESDGTDYILDSIEAQGWRLEPAG